MAQPINALTEDLIFFLQEKVCFVELLLFSPKTPEMEQPSLAKGGEERQANENNAGYIKNQALRFLGLRHNSREETKII